MSSQSEPEERTSDVLPLPSLEEGKEAVCSKSELPMLTEWDGPNDSGNPKNWSFLKKVYATFVPALYAFVV